MNSYNTITGKNNLIKKWAEDMHRHYKGRHSDGQQTHKKILNITNHQGIANQNHNEILPYTYWNGDYQKYKK